MDATRPALLHLEFAVDDPAYGTVLSTIAEGIRAAAQRIDALPESADPDWAEVTVDEECDLTENLLGAAFVVCQTQISSVASRAQWIREIARRQHGTSFSAFGKGMKSVRDLGELLAPPATATKVELLWGLANYFKHRQEWSHRHWSKLTKRVERDTVAVIQQAGLTQASTGNLRTAAEYLGNPGDYSQLFVFADIVDAWARKVFAAVKAELGVP